MSENQGQDRYLDVYIYIDREKESHMGLHYLQNVSNLIGWGKRFIKQIILLDPINVYSRTLF